MGVGTKMTLPRKTYWATLAHLLYVLCKYITKHRVTLLAVADTVAPSDHAAIVAAFDAITSACALFLAVHALVDPNAPPSE